MANTHKWNIKLPSGNLKCAKCGLIKETIKETAWITQTLPSGRQLKKKTLRTRNFYKRGNNYVMDRRGWSYARKAPPCGGHESELEVAY